MIYALVDTANTFFRARHVASRNTDTWGKIGMALHISMASVNMVVRKYGVDHVVFCLEGRSWRKDFYQPYKANRAVAAMAKTEKEQEEDKLFWETYDTFTQYLRDKTNCSVLRCATAEADDLIARFIHLHPDDHHYIVSSDTDYLQLITDSVHQYNGVTNQLITPEGYFDDKNRPVIDKKTKQPKGLDDPQFILFEKIMRGDGTDNVFAAFPGVRKKGTKNQVGLIEAFADRHKQGFNWNNLMLQRWKDHNDVEHRVRDDYERNRTLIDLKAQPDDIKAKIDSDLIEGLRVATIPQVGVHFMKFCGKYDLVKLSEQPEAYARWLNSAYKGPLKQQEPA